MYSYRICNYNTTSNKKSQNKKDPVASICVSKWVDFSYEYFSIFHHPCLLYVLFTSQKNACV